MSEAWATVVTRDAEWDDDQRQRMLAYLEYEDGVCGCGFHESLTQDKSNVFTFEHSTCPVCRGKDRYARMMAAQDDEARRALGEKPPPSAPLPSDGRTTFVKMLSDREAAELRRPSESRGVRSRQDRPHS